jgi:thiamine pyrophosphokinase
MPPPAAPVHIARCSAFYERHGVAVEARPEDQDSTDLQKCLAHLERAQAARGVVRERG